MTCTPFRSVDGTITWYFCTTPEYEYTHDGKTWRFEFSDVGGPWPLRKDGKPWKRAPGMKSKFWPAFEEWYKERGP